MMMRICILLVSAILLNGYKLSRENDPETTCFYAEDYPLDQEVEVFQMTLVVPSPCTIWIFHLMQTVLLLCLEYAKPPVT